MLLTLFKKILKNKWMYTCLMLGLMLSISIVISIPMYSNASLARLLKRDMEDFKTKTMVYPGAYTLTKTLADYKEEDEKTLEELHPAAMRSEEERPVYFLKVEGKNQKNRNEIYQTINEKLLKEFTPQLDIPILDENRIFSIYKLAIKQKIDGRPVNGFTFGKLEAMQNIGEHIKMISGRMFSNSITESGEYEVIVTQESMKTLNLILNKSYFVFQPYDNFIIKSKHFKVKVVGVYDIKNPSDPYWMGKWPTTSYRSMIMDDGLFIKDFLNGNNELVINEMFWGYALDYAKITPQNINRMLEVLEKQKISDLRKQLGVSPIMVVDQVLKTYNSKVEVVETILWIFQAPVLLILLLYIIMISNTIIKQDRNEILLMKSRGADNWQILKVYLFQAAIINIAALIIGIPLGRVLCNLISSSNGFLQFVNRKDLIMTFRLEGYLYAILVIMVFTFTILISTLAVSKDSVITDRQRRYRNMKKPFWQRAFADILCLAISAYGLYTYSVRQTIVSIVNTDDTFIPVDPLLYIISTLFIIGLGLLFLRVYPYIIKFIFWVGGRMWSPAAYVSLLNVARSETSNQFIVLFLIVTISIGTFNLKSAGTINSSLENRTKYLMGADIIVKNKWQSNIDSYPEKIQAKLRNSAVYKEPDFSKYTSITGVGSAARVLIKKEAICFYGAAEKTVENIFVMGIVPDEFGKTAFFNPKLGKTHWYNYLNIMSQHSNALLLSNSFTKQGIKEGDVIRIKWEKKGDSYIDGFVAGFIDYWPSYNPREAVMSDFVVCNLYYIQQRKLLQPYEVWIKKAEITGNEEIHKDIIGKIPDVISVDFANTKINRAKNDAILQGTNGSLSLSFLSTTIITLIGFLIYWIFSIKDRVYQFGVLRSLGLTSRSIIKIIVYEQILISGVAVAIGAFTGEINSSIFVPLIQITAKASDQVLPFRITAYAGDYGKLYSVVSFMLVSGFIILARYAARIKMDQAIKLGED